MVRSGEGQKTSNLRTGVESGGLGTKGERGEGGKIWNLNRGGGGNGNPGGWGGKDGRRGFLTVRRTKKERAVPGLGGDGGGFLAINLPWGVGKGPGRKAGLQPPGAQPRK